MQQQHYKFFQISLPKMNNFLSAVIITLLDTEHHEQTDKYCKLINGPQQSQ
jgi:hypothetical protein